MREILSLTAAFTFELKQTLLFNNAVNYRRVAAAVWARRLSDRLIDLFRIVSRGFFDTAGSGMVCHPL